MAELNLSTSTERPAITIDGTEYHLSATEDLRYKEIAFMGFAGTKIGELAQKLNDPNQYTDEAADEFEELLDRACRLALHDVPDEVYSKLKDSQRMQVMEAFSEAVNLNQKETGSRPTEETTAE